MKPLISEPAPPPAGTVPDLGTSFRRQLEPSLISEPASPSDVRRGSAAPSHLELREWAAPAVRA